MQIFGRPFRPRLWPTLFAIPAFALMLFLGFWQLERLAWKEGLIEELANRMSAPPIEMPSATTDPAALEFRRVVLSGEFLNDRELYLPGKTYKGSHGTWVVTPFRMDDGREILVNRGWVPDRYERPQSRREGLFYGPVTIEGILRQPGWGGWDSMRPDNKPDQNVWFYLDLPAMAETAHLTNAETVLYVEAWGDESTGLMPIGLDRNVQLPNDHLQYAITWFLLAGTLLVIYFLFHLRRPASK